MNLYLLDPTSRTASNIKQFERKHKTNVIVQQIDIGTHAIILADGTPDDLACCTIAHYLNGERTAGIMKPKNYRLETAIKELPFGPHIRSFLVIMDQEAKSVEEAFGAVESQLKQKGCNSSERMDPRVRVYKCDLGTQFSVTVVLNGLDTCQTKNHSIEDHLLESAGQRIVNNNSKDTWDKLPQDKKDEVIGQLLQPTKALETFPQQVLGFKTFLAE